MGIPKLSQDLRPFAEDVHLGSHTNGSSVPNWPTVAKVVIDGPSLVHFIYYRLLSWRSPGIPAIESQPSYHEISAGVVHFLRGLQLSGVDIEKIYFDGALPLSKEHTRKSRHEKARAQLHAYCVSQPDPIAKSTGLRLPLSRGIPTVWRPGPSMGGRSLSLPPPPFLVPAVIEDLRRYWTSDNISRVSVGFCDRLQVQGLACPPNKSYFGGLVEVVPGEADPYCAKLANETGAAVLSEDSDLVVYDLGQSGSAVLLRSVTCAEGDPDKEPLPLAKIQALRLWPTQILKRLRIPAIASLAFHRAIDGYATSASVQSRARENISARDFNRYNIFCAEYGSVCLELSASKRTMKGPNLLDPRVSELYYQFTNPTQFCSDGGSPIIYLPILMEDHKRESSWKYGIDLRMLAYSVLNLTIPETFRHQVVIEVRRSGHHIREFPVGLLSEDDLILQLEMHCATFALTGQPSYFDDLVRLSVQWINSMRSEHGKSRVSEKWVVSFLGRGYVDDKVTWDDVQTYANIQTILYSLRILKQLAGVAYPALTGKLRLTVALLISNLRLLPPLAAMLPARREIAASNERHETASEGVAVNLGIYSLFLSEE